MSVFLVTLSGCASLAMEGSYNDFKLNMSDEKAFSYYNVSGLCRLRNHHKSLAEGPYYSRTDPDWIALDNRILNLISKKNHFSEQDLNLVKENKIQIGMSELAAYCSWGFPIRTNKSTSSWGTSVQAVLPKDVYLYFDNGFLKSWQTSN